MSPQESNLVREKEGNMKMRTLMFDVLLSAYVSM